MKIRLANWKIKTLKSKIASINPSPQYQRPSVWSMSKKKLLIDSILRGYDLPKFYLRSTPNDLLYEFEVTDGQQRIRAITEFMSNDKKYSLDQAIINNINTKSLTYDNLGALKDDFDNYEINIAVIEEASPEEIRSLFARLQMGMQLNQVELRHAMNSNIGSAIYAVIENHEFFKECKINNSRFKHQDYMDHAFTLVYNDAKSDVKAKDIQKIYKDLATVSIDVFNEHIRRSMRVLDLMTMINSKQKGIFKNKWGFLDTFWLFYQNLDKIESINNDLFIREFKKFESSRIINNKKPEVLISDPLRADYDKDLYDYILAFNTSGNLMEKIKVRSKVFTNKFFNTTIVNYVR